MEIVFDPTVGERFWQKVRKLPGYPHADKIPLRKMLIETGALFKLPEVLHDLGVSSETPLLVVMDPTPMKRGDQSLKPLVLSTLRQADWEVRDLVLKADSSGQVHTDMPHIEEVKAQLSLGLAVLSIGSGVVTDITKHACYLFEQEYGVHIPFVVMQTANSVNAFTSSMAPTFIDGVKRTLPSRYADALVCDVETLVDAPYEMTVAGVGDLLSAFTSLPDWLLANKLGMDPSYSELPRLLMGPLDEILLDYAEDIRKRTKEGMAVLARLITLSGLTMSLSHATTPSSGYEHVISHILDLINEQRGSPLAQHGTQVVLASLLAAECYQVFLGEFDPARVQLDGVFPSKQKMRMEILKNYQQVDPSGKAGEECWHDYELKLDNWYEQRNSISAFLQDWQGIKESIQPLTRPPQRLMQILRRVDSPLWFDQLTPAFTEEQVKFAFLNAPLMRKRLTIGDVFLFFGWDREKLWERVWKSCKKISLGGT